MLHSGGQKEHFNTVINIWDYDYFTFHASPIFFVKALENVKNIFVNTLEKSLIFFLCQIIGTLFF